MHSFYLKFIKIAKCWWLRIQAPLHLMNECSALTLTANFWLRAWHELLALLFQSNKPSAAGWLRALKERGARTVASFEGKGC